MSRSTAPTSSGSRSANDDTWAINRTQKPSSDSPSAAQTPAFHGVPSGTSGHASRPINRGRIPAHTSTNG